MEGGRERRIQLLCPSLPKPIKLLVRDDQKVDLGSIARAFGLHPNTLKLNGYFISRGADLIASSLTWNSLIAFFSARGLPTGASASDALLVHGKLSQIGSKRSLDNTREMCDIRDNKRPLHEHCSVPGPLESHQHDLKRKWAVEDESSPKRTRSEEAVSGKAKNCQEFEFLLVLFPTMLTEQVVFPGLQEKKGAPVKIGRFSCSIISKNLKRMRIDEIVAAPPLKKLR